MSNFFAALDDSGDEAEFTKKITKGKKEKKEVKATLAEPSKAAPRRQRHDDRNTKSGRGRPPARDGKRTYDRRSGTGRGKEIKKGGGGGRNWGSDKDIAKKNVGAVDEKTLEKQEKVGDSLEAEEPKVEDGADAATEEKEEVKEEPEDNTMSYEDYLKSKEKKEDGVFAPVLEKDFVNEFAGKATFKVKNDEKFLVMGNGKAIRKKGSKKEDKKTLVPGFRVGDPNKRGDRGDRGDRGGRGGRDNRDRKGGRDRRGGRGRGDRKNKSSEINTADTEAFPTL